MWRKKIQNPEKSKYEVIKHIGKKEEKKSKAPRTYKL